jgi:GT2 family glycosyltransferase
LEVIVADGGSQDATVAIAKSEGCYVVDGGIPSRGRNAGAQVARSDTILFLDADVILPQDFLEQAMGEFRRRDLDIASCFLEPLTKELRSLYRLINVSLAVMQFIVPQAVGSCILVRRYVHEKLGGFNEEITVGEDLDYVRRATRVGKFGFLKDVKVWVSTRRFEGQRLVTILLKLAWVEISFLLFGRVQGDPFRHLEGWQRGHSL